MNEENFTSQSIDASQRKYPSQWFALHVLSGQESNVFKHMTSRIRTEELSDYIHEIIIPSERVSEVKRGKKVEITRKLYPGYVFVSMYLLDKNKQLVDRTWYFVQETPGVIGFADGEKPIPMRQSEVDAMLAQMRDKEDKVTPKVLWLVGDRVRVGDGPFEGQEGVIEGVDEARGRVNVAVSIFGRSTPVELEYWQIEKIEE
ncbi:MAG: transcription termination/antitermination protein NusG [Verrucomicrobiales bacterium]|jgi:transcriptional antiterminator NusG|nr:transcription termination/antitermination protein NusG [Verrucomicrobiales bacterium]